MKYSKFFKFLEKKDHLISKLISLTPEQKQKVIAFFTKHPKYENEIDWNRKDLEWEDFEEVIYKERVSRAQLKNFIKKDKHFLVLYSDSNCVLYQPLTWLGSIYLASTDVKPKVEGKWCISYQKDRHYWDDYSLKKKKSFIIICTNTTKYALEISPEGTFVPWNAKDINLNQSEFYNEISKEVPGIKSFLKRYRMVAIGNHSLVEQMHEKDLEEGAYIEKMQKAEKEYRIRIFSKSFKRQIKKKGYYEWNGDITYDDLENLGLIDEKGNVDERLRYFKISGNLDVKLSPITSITVPSSITSIKKPVFEGCSYLTSITIPDSVTSIESSAFSSCWSLESIYISKEMFSIPGMPWGASNATVYWNGKPSISHPYLSINAEGVVKCTDNKVKEVDIPEYIHGTKATSIGSDAFKYCSPLTSVTLPNSVTSIAVDAFCKCLNLVSVNLGNNVNKIDGWAFYKCSSLSKINLPSSLRTIGISAFNNCKSLTEINIPSNVTSIDTSTFKNCISLTKIEIPDSVVELGDDAFENCSSLTSAVIGNSVTEIKDNTFRECTALSRVLLGNSIVSIGDRAFYNCSSLKSIIIPSSVSSIGELAFFKCKSLKTVYIDKEKDSLDLSKARIPAKAKIYWKGEF